MFEKIEKFVSCVCVSVMAILVFANVVSRFAFKHSMAVSDEMSTYLFVLMSFMGTAIAARRKAHLGLSIVTDHVSPRARLIIGLLMYAVSALFCLLIVISDGGQPIPARARDRYDAVARVDLRLVRSRWCSICHDCFFADDGADV
mgnify:CR=1 FL=1